jgi:hypothetical protein
MADSVLPIPTQGLAPVRWVKAYSEAPLPHFDLPYVHTQKLALIPLGRALPGPLEVLDRGRAVLRKCCNGSAVSENVYSRKPPFTQSHPYALDRGHEAHHGVLRVPDRNALLPTLKRIG